MTTKAYKAGYADGTDWTHDGGSTIDQARAALGGGVVLPDENLINAIGRDETSKLLGVVCWDGDGLTAAGQAALDQYNQGFHTALREWLAEEVQS